MVLLSESDCEANQSQILPSYSVYQVVEFILKFANFFLRLLFMISEVVVQDFETFSVVGLLAFNLFNT